MRVPTLCTLALVLAACGSSGKGGLSLASLAGTWSGWFEDGGARVSSIALDLDNAGAITAVRQGGVDQSTTGLFSRTTGAVFAGFLGGNAFFLMVDSTGKYAILITEPNGFMVLEKNAVSAPAIYTVADLAGSYNGRVLRLGDLFTYDRTLSSSITVRGNGQFDGLDSDGTPFGDDVALSIVSPGFGRFIGRYQARQESGPLLALMSFDKRFLAVRACLDGFSFPRECSFRGYHMR
jgi:hypothetical protein